MKRYVLGILVTFALLAPSARAAETVFGFLDGKFYDSTATLRYQCFMDGNCYDLEGKLAPFKLVPVSQPVVATTNQQPSANPVIPAPINGPIQQPVTSTPITVTTNEPVALTSIPVSLVYVDDTKMNIWFSTDLPTDAAATLVEASCTGVCPAQLWGGGSMANNIDGKAWLTGLNTGIKGDKQMFYFTSQTYGSTFGKSDWKFKFISSGNTLTTELSVPYPAPTRDQFCATYPSKMFAGVLFCPNNN